MEFLTYTACNNLKWLSQQVPARVHLANVRLHFNGWHTECRYQVKNSTCRFCHDPDSEDRIEHYLKCSFVHSFFPDSWKMGQPPRVPIGKFFLFCLPDDEKVAMAIFIFGLYSICNQLRHCDIKPELHQALRRTMGEIYLKPSARNTWDGIFGFPRPPEQHRPRVHTTHWSRDEYNDRYGI